MNCNICARPVYGATAHPCCVFWARIAPGRPCAACSASTVYWATVKPRLTPTVPYVAAVWSCSTCGLSDDGHTRLVDLGFTPHPCIKCRDHFNTEGKIAA